MSDERSVALTVLETPRLVLRRYTPDDLDALAVILGDPTTMAFWPRPFERAEAAAWNGRALDSYAAHGFGRWAALAKDTGALVGDCGLLRTTLAGEEVVDLGYIVHHPRWRQGLAQEAAAAVRDHAFDVLGLPRLVANMAHDHVGSARVAEKIGMVRVGAFDNPRNRGIRTLLYAIERPARGQSPSSSG